MSVYSRQKQNAQGGFGAENSASDLSTQVHGRRKLHIRHRAVRCTLQIRYCNGRPHEVQDMCVIRRRREAREPQNAFEGGGGSRWVSPPIAVKIEKKDVKQRPPSSRICSRIRQADRSKGGVGYNTGCTGLPQAALCICIASSAICPVRPIHFLCTRCEKGATQAVA